MRPRGYAEAMRRTARTLLLAAALLLLSAPAALAAAHDGGEGLYGETNDKVVTNAGFILIAFFPLLIFTLSMIQWRLDKRKDARKAAEKARRARADVRGGW
jgi:preprotein translocase subunit SecG